MRNKLIYFTLIFWFLFINKVLPNNDKSIVTTTNFNYKNGFFNLEMRLINHSEQNIYIPITNIVFGVNYLQDDFVLVFPINNFYTTRITMFPENKKYFEFYSDNYSISKNDYSPYFIYLSTGDTFILINKIQFKYSKYFKNDSKYNYEIDFPFITETQFKSINTFCYKNKITTFKPVILKQKTCFTFKTNRNQHSKEHLFYKIKNNIKIYTNELLGYLSELVKSNRIIIKGVIKI